MIEVCNRPDGPVSYLSAVNSDYMAICGIVNSQDINELAKRISNISFERLSTKRCRMLWMNLRSM